MNDDILRSDRAKSRAHVARANEEVLLLREEMRRTLEFLEWKAVWWEKREALQKFKDKAMVEGVRAYAHEQAALHECSGPISVKYGRAHWMSQPM